jgi:GNAT superfamily N-acetyltransferase
MTQPYPHNPEIASPFAFREVKIAGIEHLITESQFAFVPPASDPEQTAASLFEAYQKVEDFRVQGFVDGDEEAVSYIVTRRARLGALALGPMYVASSQQGKGLGRRQVEIIVQQAGGQGYDAIHTKTWATNSGSRAIFAGTGFQETETIIGDRANGDATVEYCYKFPPT